VTTTAKPMLLRVQGVANMSLEQGAKVALMAVKTCSKALLALSRKHGKSPCFLQVAFLQLVSPDYPLLVLPCVDGREFLECAF
jgi:hypothetical protein